MIPRMSDEQSKETKPQQAPQEKVVYLEEVDPSVFRDKPNPPYLMIAILIMTLILAFVNVYRHSDEDKAAKYARKKAEVEQALAKLRELKE